MTTATALWLSSFTFLVAALAKLRSATSTEESLRSFGLAPALARLGRTVLPGAEIVVAVLLVLPWTFRIGAVAAIAMLTLFSLAIAYQLARGRNPNCSCFGSSSNTPISHHTLVRNAVLMTPALAVLLGLTRLIDTLIVAFPAILISVALAILSTGIVLVVVMLWQQQAKLVSRVESLEANASTNPATELPGPLQTVDLSAPVQSLAGTTTTLANRLAGVRRALLIFIHPECSPCKELLDDIRGHKVQERGDLRVLFAVSGPIEQSKEMLSFMSAEHVIRLEPNGAASNFGVRSTPAAVLIAPPGDIVSRANGRTAVLDLLNGKGAISGRQLSNSYGKQTTGRGTINGL